MEMDCIPAGMELFPAADEEQFEFIKRVIDDCDYYLIIIGGRYGSVTAEGVSYTEKEYDYAVESSLNVIAFLHENPDEIPVGKSDIDPVMRKRLKRFREKVATNRLVKFWKSAEELPGLVALNLSKAIKSFPAVGWVRASNTRKTIGTLNLIEYSGKRDFSLIIDIANKALNKSGKKVLHIFMTNFDLKKQGSLRDEWNKFFIEKGKQVYQHLFYCIRSVEDCDFILEQVAIIRELTKNGKPINYELRVIFDLDQTELNPWSILVLGDQVAFLSHDTKDDKKLSLQCYLKSDVERIKSLWESYREKENRLLYSKKDGIRHENIEYLNSKKLFYSAKISLQEEDVYRISRKIISYNLFLSEPISCYLIGSSSSSNAKMSNDIDLVFLFTGEPRHPEEMVNLSLLTGISNELNINLNLNGIPYIEDKNGHLTVDLLCDWTEYIKKHDSVSIIDIAHSNYKKLWGRKDAYSELKNIELSKKLITDRIQTSYKYVKRNCNSNKAALIKVAGKQFLQLFAMLESSIFNPSIYIQTLNENNPISYFRPVLAFYSPESFIGTNIIVDILNNYQVLTRHLEKRAQA